MKGREETRGAGCEGMERDDELNNFNLLTKKNNATKFQLSRHNLTHSTRTLILLSAGKVVPNPYDSPSQPT